MDIPSCIRNIVDEIINYSRIHGNPKVDIQKDYVNIFCHWKVILSSRDNEAGQSSKGVKSIEEVWWQIPYSFPQKPITPWLSKKFPRTQFPHINPSLPDSCVSPCIVDESLTNFIIANGMNSALDQLSDWLDKAAQNRLMDDEQGWEPVIFRNYGGNIVDAGNFIVKTAKNLLDQASINSGIRELDCRYQIYGDHPFYVRAHLGVLDNITTYETIYNTKLILVTLPESDKTQEFQNYPVSKRSELIFLAKSLTGSAAIDSSVIAMPDVELLANEILEVKLKKYDADNELCRPSYKDEKNVVKLKPHPGCIVILAIPRALPLIGSDCNVELIPFFVRLSSTENADPQVLPLRYLQNTSSTLLKRTSFQHDRKNNRVAFLGAGSVGSKIATSLARTGTYELQIIDNGCFYAHNTARHSLVETDGIEGMPKAMALGQSIKSWGVLCGWRPDNLTEDLAVDDDIEILIESTGNEQVSHYLTFYEGLEKQLIQVGTYDAASLGYIAIEPRNRERKVRIDDLEAYLYGQAVIDSDLKARLFNAQGAEKLPIGHGCSSITTIMPDTYLNLTVSAMTAKIDRYLNTKIGNEDHGHLNLCFRCSETDSIFWKHYDFLSTLIIKIKNQDIEWSIRINSNAVKDMYSSRKNKLPVETGGALIGIINELTSTIYVTHILQAPSTAIEAYKEFTMEYQDLSKADAEIKEMSNNQLSVLGTWHSHTEPSKPSMQDYATYAELCSLTSLKLPIMLMCDGNSIQGIFYES